MVRGLHRQSLLIGLVAGTSLAVLGGSVLGCQRKGDGKSAKGKTSSSSTSAPGGGALPAQSDAELATPLAKVDDVTISVGEFQERINRQAPYIRARYTSLEQKKEFLDNIIKFEVLAKEAFKRGFDQDPEVVRTMKQVMITKLMKDEFETKFTPDSISEEELRTFYKTNEAEYVKPEEVRVSAVVLSNKSQAEKVAGEAKGEAGRTNKGFRELVTKYSTDEVTKIRGGDLRYFARNNKEIPAGVIAAGFALEKTGDVSGAVEGGDGKYYVLKQTGRRKAVAKSFEDVKLQIRNRLYREKRVEAQKTFVDNLRTQAKVEVLEDNLGKVRIDTSQPAQVDPHGHGMARPKTGPGPGGDPAASDPSTADPSAEPEADPAAGDPAAEVPGAP
jgi:peptidyl-prolyl cis-trans isomerase C